MAILDFSHLTARQRLELIGELWDSLGPGDVPLPPAQAAEIDRRLATLDRDIDRGQDDFAVYDELSARYR